MTMNESDDRPKKSTWKSVSTFLWAAAFMGACGFAYYQYSIRTRWLDETVRVSNDGYTWKQMSSVCNKVRVVVHSRNGEAINITVASSRGSGTPESQKWDSILDGERTFDVNIGPLGGHLSVSAVPSNPQRPANVELEVYGAD